MDWTDNFMVSATLEVSLHSFKFVENEFNRRNWDTGTLVVSISWSFSSYVWNSLHRRPFTTARAYSISLEYRDTDYTSIRFHSRPRRYLQQSRKSFSTIRTASASKSSSRLRSSRRTSSTDCGLLNSTTCSNAAGRSFSRRWSTILLHRLLHQLVSRLLHLLSIRTKHLTVAPSY